MTKAQTNKSRVIIKRSKMRVERLKLMLNPERHLKEVIVEEAAKHNVSTSRYVCHQMAKLLKVKILDTI